MQLKSTAFEARVKNIGVKCDGVEVKLVVPSLNGALLQELAGMMALGTIDVTLAAKVEQQALPFAEPSVKMFEKRPDEGFEPSPGTLLAACDDDPEEAEPGPNVGWILRNSVNDINYRNAVPELTDEELRYCLKREARKTGLQQLRAEARRRGMKLDEQPAVAEAGAQTRPAFF